MHKRKKNYLKVLNFLKPQIYYIPYLFSLLLPNKAPFFYCPLNQQPCGKNLGIKAQKKNKRNGRRNPMGKKNFLFCTIQQTGEKNKTPFFPMFFSITKRQHKPYLHYPLYLSAKAVWGPGPRFFGVWKKAPNKIFKNC